MQVETLFTPVRIGRLEVKNRVVMPPMVTLYSSPTQEVTQRLVDYYVARATGGVGLIIVEAIMVQDDGRIFTNQLGIDRDEFIPGLRSLTSAVQGAGAKIAVQLHHGGRRAIASITGKPLIAPSAVASRMIGITPKEMSVEEIAMLTCSFGEAGRRAREAGFDAVELHGAHSYILQEFLSPWANKRADEYGGSPERRLRFPLEVVRAIKREAGADFPIIYRMNGEETVEGGLTRAEAKEAARQLVKAGADAIHVSVGPEEPLIPTWIPPMEVKQGWITDLAKGIREVVDVPDIAVGRITHPKVAERILKDGKADLVAIGRGLLADPDWVAKAERGASAQIRRCIGCNEGCLTGLRFPEGITCIYNPDVGRERAYVIRPAARRKRVMVVGGGPAGMEAARVAALRGHEVALYEQEPHLGGQLALAARIPGRGEFGSLIRYYEEQLAEAGVKVHVDFRVNAGFAEDQAPDALVIATGIKPLVPGTKAKWTPETVTAYDVLAGKEEVGERVLILGGGLVGFDTAVLLAERGKHVRVVELLPGGGVHPLPEPTHAMQVFNRLRERRVGVFCCTQAIGARDGVVTVSQEGREELLGRYLFTGSLRERGFREFEERSETAFGDYDTLVLALGAEAEQSLAVALGQSKISEVYVIGDAAQPQKVLQAIHHGADIGRKI